LDKIQKGLGKEVDINDAKKLKKEKLIEGKRPRYILSSKVAEIIGKQADYTENKGFTDDEISMFIIKHLKNFGDGMPRKEINRFVWKFLPGVLSEEQKYKKVQRILTKLKEDGSIEKINGKTKDSMWILKRE